MIKKIALIVLLLATTSLGADKYPPRTGGAFNWSDSVWSAADDDAQNLAKPDATDTVILTANSQTGCTVNETVNAKGLSIANAYGPNAISFNDQTFNIGTDGFVNSADVVEGGTEIFVCDGNFENNVNVPGGTSITMTGTSKTIKTMATGTVVIDGSISVLTRFSPNALTVTTGNSLDLNGITVGCDSFAAVSGTPSLDVNGGTLDVDGNCDLTGFTVTDTAGLGAIECEGDFTITGALDDTISIFLNGASSNVSANVSTNPGLLNIDSSGTITAVTDQNWASIMFIGGEFDWDDKTITVANSVSVGTTGQLDVGTSTLNLGGTFDGTDLAMAGEAVGGLPATIEGGTIENVNMSGLAHIDARGINGSQPVDGGGNTNVRFARGLVGGGIF